MVPRVVRLTNAQPAKLPPGSIYGHGQGLSGPGGSTDKDLYVDGDDDPGVCGHYLCSGIEFTVRNGSSFGRGGRFQRRRNAGSGRR